MAFNSFLFCANQSLECRLDSDSPLLMRRGGIEFVRCRLRDQNVNNGVASSFVCLCQDESRIKATVMDVKPVDHKEYSKRLIVNIRKMAAQ